MSDELPLIDGFGRIHDDLRLSVTDRCNIRCRYCIAAKVAEFRPREEILSFEEIERFVRLCARLGVSKVRITGGEPLVRRNICGLVRRLAAIDGIDDLAMTTNGTLLPKFARPLREAGLQRVNISLDTLREEHFREISGRDLLPMILEGIDAAIEAGFAPIKLNALAIRGQTEEEIPRLAKFARERGLQLRFIEFMPLDAPGEWRPEKVLPADEIYRIIDRSVAKLAPLAEAEMDGPARVFRYRDGQGSVGMISTVTHPFCERCSRLRLTADGRILNCLFCREPVDVKSLLRGGASDVEIMETIRRAVLAKRRQHGNDEGVLARGERAMNDIGG
ncbi:MAG: GTP 3',8-cyclase MoaA [Planctomycetota bacterium]|nr:MAG: GTP 3',8-cyclase MoaA [Planctomycetota bacterium]